LQLEVSSRPGLVELCWSSLNIDNYFNVFADALVLTENLVRQILDIKTISIDKQLDALTETMLSTLPGTEPWTVEEFLAKTKVNNALQSFELA
jgi:hypothetical protein